MAQAQIDQIPDELEYEGEATEGFFTGDPRFHMKKFKYNFQVVQEVCDINLVFNMVPSVIRFTGFFSSQPASQ